MQKIALTEKQIQDLIRDAIAAREKSYSPYSEFQVGSALLAASGRVYTGANIENASSGATICAERSAATHAVSEGEREFAAIAIVGWKKDAEDEERGLAYPCGICRQFLNEFSDPDMPVFIARTPVDYLATTLGELLPYSFGPESLA